MGLIGQQSAVALIDITVALGRAQGIHILRVARAGVDQFAQVIEVDVAQGRQVGHRHGRPGADMGGERRFNRAAIRNQFEGGGAQKRPAQRREHQAHEHQTPDFGMPALTEVATNGPQQVTPAAQASGQQQRPGHRQHQHE